MQWYSTLNMHSEKKRKEKEIIRLCIVYRSTLSMYLVCSGIRHSFGRPKSFAIRQSCITNNFRAVSRCNHLHRNHAIRNSFTNLCQLKARNRQWGHASTFTSLNDSIQSSMKLAIFLVKFEIKIRFYAMVTAALVWFVPTEREVSERMFNTFFCYIAAGYTAFSQRKSFQVMCINVSVRLLY